ncbi:MAG: pyridoxamine 5'-phosphate oxidase family protein [Acidimicrobiia bacterium]|nr:pyridoxamine 5'-phosphate oxidase family protein [Acidimicrobiia bacterium]
MARKDITMSPAEIDAFLAAPRNMALATLGADGFPHVAPMWYVMRDGAIVFRSFTKSQKMVNLKRDPRLTVLAESGDAYSQLKGVMIKGEAQLNDDHDFVLDVYVELATRYPMAESITGTADKESLRAAYAGFAAKNTAVTVIPSKTISWDHTKLGAAY